MKTKILIKVKMRTLIKAYEKAIKKNEEMITLEGHEFLTKYVMYLLEYLKSVGRTEDDDITFVEKPGKEKKE